MSFSLLWLPHVLEQAGLKVATVDGWQDAGGGDVGAIMGVICHHTAGGRRDLNMPTLNTLIKGRSDLAGPLAQLGLGRDGTYYVIAAGRCNHAGKGAWRGVVTGNTNFIGIEAENTGRADDFPWPAVQIDAYHRGVAAILKHLGLSAQNCAGHKEYALPRGRKTDPSLDMNQFRSAVAALLADNAPPPVLIPRAEPQGSPNRPPRPTLRRDSNESASIRELQRMLGIREDGKFGATTEAAVRAAQRKQGIVPDGIVGPKTWAALDAAAGPG